MTDAGPFANGRIWQAGSVQAVSMIQSGLLLAITLGSAGLIGAISLYSWRRRGTKGALPLALVGGLLVLWCLAAAGEVVTADPWLRELSFLFRDALTLPGVILALWFALEYAGLRRWLSRPVVTVLAGAVLVDLALYFVDGGRLLWSVMWWDQGIYGDRGPLGLLFGALAFGLFLTASAVFILLFVRSPAHRVPVALILLGQVTMRVAYSIDVFNVADVPNIPVAVLSFDLIAVMYAIALFRFRLFDLVPLARDTILERMPDAMIVVDPYDRIAEVNPAAVGLLDLESDHAIGRPLATALERYPQLAARITAADTDTADVALDTSADSRTFEVSEIPLADWQGSPIGRLLLLHETTALRRVEAQLIERERALAAAQEREWVARELHDGLAQDLWLAKLKAARLAAIPGLRAEARALTGELSAAVDAGLVEAQQAVAAMRLSSEPGGSLQDLLVRSLDDFEDQFGLRVAFECDATLPALSAHAEAEALHVVQEALTNVRRHADATVVRVHAGTADGRVVLSVADNGRGFDIAAVGDKAYGLASMRERAFFIGGELQIESAPRKGTRVSLCIPVEQAASVQGVTR